MKYIFAKELLFNQNNLPCSNGSSADYVFRNRKEMDKKVKVRLSLFVICTTISSVMSIVSTYTYSTKLHEKLSPSDSFYIDGSDFSPAIDLAKSIGKGLSDYVSFIGSEMLVFFIGLVLFFAFYLIDIKNNDISIAEHKKYIFFLLAFFVVSFLICLVVLRFSDWTSALFINLGWALMAFCFVILPSGKKKE